MTTFQVHHSRKNDPPLGMCVEPFQPPTLPDPDAEDPAGQKINATLPLLTDRSCSVFELCRITGLNLSELADLLESDRMTTSLDNLERAISVRERAVAIHKKFTADSALLNLASTVPMDAREAEPVRKAATHLNKPPPTGAGGVPAPRSGAARCSCPSPAPAGEVSGSCLTQGVFPDPPPSPTGEVARASRDGGGLSFISGAGNVPAPRPSSAEFHSATRAQPDFPPHPPNPPSRTRYRKK